MDIYKELFIYLFLFIIYHPSHFSSPEITEDIAKGFTKLPAISQWELERDILILFSFFCLRRDICDSVSVCLVNLG